MNKIRTLLWISLICCFLFSGQILAYTEGQRVFDDAGLFSEEEIRTLEKLCVSYAEETKTDFVIVTTEDAGWKSSEEFADDFYDEGDFGYDRRQGTGVLFLIDMDNRNLYISTCGDAIYYMTDERIDNVLDAVYEEVRKQEYGQGAKVFLEKTKAFLLKDPYAKPTLKERVMASLRNTPVYLILSAIVALISAQIMKKTRPFKNTVEATTYWDEGSFQLVQRDDILVDERTYTERIYRDDRTGGHSGGGGGGSSTHVSSGGVTHGGGGHGF